MKTLIKSIIPVMMFAFVGYVFTACSDNGDQSAPFTPESIEDIKIFTYQPEGVLQLRLRGQGANVSLDKDKFQVLLKSYNISGSPDLDHVSPSFKVKSVEVIDGKQVLKLEYNLNGWIVAYCSLEVEYDGRLLGMVDVNMQRAHEYKVLEFDTNKSMSERYLFPVFDFLDELKINRMDVEELGIKDQLFLSEGEYPMYPALKNDGSSLYAGGYGHTSEGEIFITDLKNGRFGQLYSVINKIKLPQPDAEGNEYIWLEFPFVLKAEDIQ